MARLDGKEVYGIALAAFNRAGITGHDAETRAMIATGISKLESGWNTNARGDTGIQDRTWGPSIGLWQIRSLNSQLGSGGARDEQSNTDPAHNAAAMVTISGGGTNWQPWTVWTNAAKQEQVKAEAVRVGLSMGFDTAGVAGVYGGVPGTVGIGDIGNAITHPVDVVAGAGTVIGAIPGIALDPLKALGRLLSFLLDPAFWRRVGMGALGVLLVIAGAYVALTDIRKAANAI